MHTNCIVNITAQSLLKVDVELLEKTYDENLQSLQGNPIAGNNCTVSFIVYNLGSNGSCDIVSTVDITGSIISLYIPVIFYSDFGCICTSEILIPEEEFKLMIYGTDNSGYSFSRKIGTIFQPSFFKLRMVSPKDDIVVNQETDIEIAVTYYGSSTNTYSVTITDDYGYIQSATSYQINIETDDTITVAFRVKPTTPSQLLYYTISSVDRITGTVEQSIRKTFVVSDVGRHLCKVLSSPIRCETASLNTANCSLYTWNSSEEVIFSGTEIQYIVTTAGSSVTLVFDNVTNLMERPVIVNVSGDCCTPLVYVTVIDVDGFIAQCMLDMSDGQPVVSVERVTDQNTVNQKLTIIGIVVGTTCAIILFLILVRILRNLYKMQNLKVNTIYVSEVAGRQYKVDNTLTDVFNDNQHLEPCRAPTFITMRMESSLKQVFH